MPAGDAHQANAMFPPFFMHAFLLAVLIFFCGFSFPPVRLQAGPWSHCTVERYRTRHSAVRGNHGTIPIANVGMGTRTRHLYVEAAMPWLVVATHSDVDPLLEHAQQVLVMYEIP